MLRFALLNHKCGTVYVNKVLDKYCKENMLTFSRYSVLFNPNGTAYKNKRFSIIDKYVLGRQETFKYYNPKADIFFIPTSIYNLLILPLEEPYKGFHVVRDPRDVIVSGYFSHKISHPVKNRFGKLFLLKRRKLLNEISKEKGLMLEIRKGYSLKNMNSWKYDDPNIMEIKFENLILDPFSTFMQVFKFLELGIDEEKLKNTIEYFSFKKLSGGRDRGQEDVSNHFRKGVAGDWKNHFNEEHKKVFKKNWGGLLIKLGYEKSDDW